MPSRKNKQNRALNTRQTPPAARATALPAHDEVPSDRLFEAVEAVLEAAVELAARDHAYTPPMHTMGTSRQPASLDAFTRYEVCAATLFLRRMGYLPETAE